MLGEAMLNGSVTFLGEAIRLLTLIVAPHLARLHRDQGRRTEARDLLTPVYGCFTEGFSRPDLKDAKALLDELA